MLLTLNLISLQNGKLGMREQKKEFTILVLHLGALTHIELCCMSKHTICTVRDFTTSN